MQGALLSPADTLRHRTNVNLTLALISRNVEEESIYKLEGITVALYHPDKCPLIRYNNGCVLKDKLTKKHVPWRLHPRRSHKPFH